MLKKNEHAGRVKVYYLNLIVYTYIRNSIPDRSIVIRSSSWYITAEEGASSSHSRRLVTTTTGGRLVPETTAKYNHSRAVCG